MLLAANLLAALTVGREQYDASAHADAKQEGGKDGQTQECGAGLAGSAQDISANLITTRPLLSS